MNFLSMRSHTALRAFCSSAKPPLYWGDTSSEERRYGLTSNKLARLRFEPKCFEVDPEIQGKIVRCFAGSRAASSEEDFKSAVKAGCSF